MRLTAPAAAITPRYDRGYFMQRDGAGVSPAGDGTTSLLAWSVPAGNRLYVEHAWFGLVLNEILPVGGEAKVSAYSCLTSGANVEALLVKCVRAGEGPGSYGPWTFGPFTIDEGYDLRMATDTLGGGWHIYAQAGFHGFRYDI